MDFIQTFFNWLNNVRPDVKPLTRDQQRRVHHQLCAALHDIPVRQLSPERRQQLLGKRTLSLPLQVYRCAQGLDRLPALASALQIQPEHLRVLVNQDLNLGGLIKVFEVAHQGARDRLLVCGERADAITRTARTAVIAAMQHPTTTTSQRRQLSSLFGPSLGLAQKIADQVAPLEPPLELPPLERLTHTNEDRSPSVAEVQELVSLARAAPAAGRALFAAPFNLSDLAARMRRLTDGEPPRPLAFAEQEITPEALAVLSPAAIDRFSSALSEPAALLSELVLTDDERQLLKRHLSLDMDLLLSSFASAIDLAAPLSPSLQGLPSAAALRDLREESEGYRVIARTAAVGVNRMLDVRLLLGGLLWSALETVMSAVIARLEDPATPRAAALDLHEAFDLILLHRDQVLRDRAADKATRAELQAAAQAELQRAEDERVLQDVLQAIRLHLPVEPQRVQQALRVLRARKTAAAEESARAAPAPGPARPRQPLVR